MFVPDMPPNNDAPIRTRPHPSAFPSKPCLRCSYDLRSQIDDKDTILVCPECNWQGKVGQLYDPTKHGFDGDVSLVLLLIQAAVYVLAAFIILPLVAALISYFP